MCFFFNPLRPERIFFAGARSNVKQIVFCQRFIYAVARKTGASRRYIWMIRQSPQTSFPCMPMTPFCAGWIRLTALWCLPESWHSSC